MRASGREVAVVGGGPAGLAAAWVLAGAGARVTLYERRSRPGGWLRTDRLDGVLADVGVQLLASYFEETFRLARAVGAAELLVRAPGRDALWRGGRVHGLTYGSVASMAASTALPAGLKLRLATRYLAFLKRHATVLDANEPVRAESLDGESIAAWGRRELGEEFIELLAYPQLAAYYGSTPEETSAGVYHGLARAGLDVALFAVRGGMGELASAVVRALASRGVEVRTQVEVRAVRPGAAAVEVAWEGGETRHDGVILAVPAPVAHRVLSADDAELRDWLGAVRAAPSAAVALVVERAPAGDFFGVSFPRTSPPGDRIAVACVQERKRAGLAGGGLSALVVYAAPAFLPRIAGATPDELLGQLLPAVEQALPELRGRIVRARAYRSSDGGTLFYPGYLGHLRSFDAAWEPRGIALAGDYLVAPTVEGAVRSGRRAAERLLAG